MKKNIFTIILIILITSCSVNTLNQKTIKILEHKTPFTILRGEALKLQLNIPKNDYSFELKCNNINIPYFINNHKVIAYISESYFSKLKNYSCDYYFPKFKKSFKIATINVQDKSFPSEKLMVNKKRVFLSEKDKKRTAKEWKLTSALYANFSYNPYFDKPFQMPINSKVTSIYGSQRIYNNKKQTQHLGTDFRAKIGAPIKTTNSGKVVLAQDLFYTGGTVIVDHGMGIFTVYGHLSKILSLKGEFIPRGTVIGLAGATGRVTGPHLHWGVKIQNQYIDGLSLIKTSNDK